LFVGFGVFFSVVGLSEHPSMYGTGVDPLVVLWFAFIALPFVALVVLVRTMKESIILLNEKSVDLVETKRGEVTINRMPWSDIAVKMVRGESVSTKLSTPERPVTISGPYVNLPHFYSYLEPMMPTGLTDRDWKYVHLAARPSRSKPSRDPRER